MIAADELLAHAQGKALIGDTGYDSNRFRQAVRDRGMKPVINSKPAVDVKPIVEKKPTVNAKPAVESKPAVKSNKPKMNAPKKITAAEPASKKIEKVAK